ncbi:MAG: Fe-S cluster assembly protein SufD [Patescibacteria group bacterium]|nr:Fe-S cluster assembly protein SufD [Patescibacteria group bacterium]
MTMYPYGLKVSTPYKVEEVKRIYNAFGDLILSEPGNYEVYCTGDTYIHHNIIEGLTHITCITSEDDIEISIRCSGETYDDAVADIYHKIVAKNKNIKSKIECKGVSNDQSRIIYRSSLLAEEGSTGSGNQKAKFLLLSDTAEIDAEPSLDIASQNFPTSHSVGISNIDQMKMWYMFIRGYGKEEASNKIVEGFLN